MASHSVRRVPTDPVSRNAGRSGRIPAHRGLRSAEERTPGGPVPGLLAALLLVLVLVLLPVSTAEAAPQSRAAVEWIVVERGERPRTLRTEAPLDSLDAVARRVVQGYQEDGYYLAAVTTVDTTAREAGPISESGEERRSAADAARAGAVVRVTLHVDPGRRSELERIEWTGVDSTTAGRLADLLAFGPGSVVHPERLHAGLDAARAWLRREGHPVAEVRVGGARLAEETGELVLRISVDLGPAPTLSAVRISDSLRTDPGYVARLAGFRMGRPVERFDPEEIRRRLRRSGLFERVGRPRLELRGSEEAELRVPLTEREPGSFDLALGYQPSSGGSGGLVGSGHLALRNPFGGGRRFRFDLHRMPGRISRTRVEATVPYPLGMPIRVRGRFEGYQQDSTYGSRDLELAGLTRIDSELWAGLTLRRTAVREGVAAGAAAVSARNGWFAGFQLRWDRRDRPVSPTEGVLLELAAEEGRVVPTSGGAAERRHRLTVRGRTYWSPGGPHVLVGGADGRYVGAEGIQLSDLYRVGGATSLRGYNDEQFAVDALVRTLLEYRLRTDATSYVFAFAEGGYLHRPRYGTVPERSSIRPSFGAGLQMQTELGLVNVAYAANGRDGLTEGRVHVRLRMGL